MKKIIRAIILTLILTNLSYEINGVNAFGLVSNSSKPKIIVKTVMEELEIKNYESIMNGVFENTAYKEAWQDYKKIINKVTIGTEYNDSSIGTTFDEFKESKLIDKDPKEIILGEKTVCKIYRYTSTKPFNESINKDKATVDLMMVYNKNKLVYVGLYNNSFNLKESNIILQDNVEKLVKEPFDFDKLGVKEPIVTGFGTIVINNHTYSVISMLSGGALNPVVEYFAITKGKLDYITSKSFEEAMENTFILNISAIKDYIENDSLEFYKLSPKSSNSHN